MTDTRAHWDGAYTAKAENQVSWFQVEPGKSLALIRDAAKSRDAGIVDIGGGASVLVDTLLRDGYSDLTVLDVSEVALGRTQARLGAAAEKVSWIVADITRWRPPRRWDVWHDRAVFHFLTDRADQDAYIAALTAATAPGAAILMATFAPDGPEKCSGLPVQRYSPSTIATRLGSGFRLYAEAAEDHVTPWGSTQKFAYAALKRL